MIPDECTCVAYLEFVVLSLLRCMVQCTKRIGLYGVVSCDGGRSESFGVHNTVCSGHCV